MKDIRPVLTVVGGEIVHERVEDLVSSGDG
jgi:hypothetical protein